MPLDESAELGFTSPYAVSKVAVENFAAYYRGRGLDWTVHHLGPGQSTGFLLPDLYAAARTARETGEPLAVGNLATRRDYTDVRDVVSAYLSLLETESLDHGVYHVCSGTSTSGQELLDLLLERCGWDGIDVVVDPARLRPHDPVEIVGSAARLHAQTGWKPSLTLAETVSDFVGSHEA
jgi:GDP-4-dehydro-6-deoxy-D-mannose reductase